MVHISGCSRVQLIILAMSAEIVIALAFINSNVNAFSVTNFKLAITKMKINTETEI